MRAGTVRGGDPCPAMLKVVRDAIQMGFKSLMGLPVAMLPPRLAVLRICSMVGIISLVFRIMMTHPSCDLERLATSILTYARLRQSEFLCIPTRDSTYVGAYACMRRVQHDLTSLMTQEQQRRQAACHTCTPANQRSCSTTARKVDVLCAGCDLISARSTSSSVLSGTEAPTRRPPSVTSICSQRLALLCAVCDTQ